MKSVLLALPSDSFFLPILKKKLKARGFSVFYYDYRYGDRFAKVVSKTFGKKMANIYINVNLFFMIKKLMPDYLLAVKGESISPLILKLIKDTGTKSINWFPDPLNYWDVMKKISPHYDYFFHFDPQVVKKLKTLGLTNIYYLPFAAETHSVDKPSTYDISFVGTYDQFREKYLLALKGYNLNIWGDKRWYHSKLNRFVRGERITPRKMHDIIGSSKININFHHKDTKEGTNLRTFQVVSCGAFLLTEYKKDLKTLFNIDKDIVTFKTTNELKAMVERFLSKDELRKKISTSGYLRFKNNHRYENRLNRMFQIIEKNNNK